MNRRVSPALARRAVLLPARRAALLPARRAALLLALATFALGARAQLPRATADSRPGSPPATQPTARPESQPAAKPAGFELVIYAAASTRDALRALQPLYTRQSGVALVFNFGSSGDLARQIAAAGKADLFLSADELEMDRVAAAGLLLADTRRVLLANQLVVIEPIDPLDPKASLFAPPFAAAQLAQPRLARLSLANVESVPAGRYAKQWLERCGAWESVRERVLPAVDVRAALAAVESGAAHAGIVYRTDVAHSQRARVVHAVPLEEGPRIRYPLAVLAERPHMAAARELADFLAGAQARECFAREGFLPAEAASASR